MRGGLTLSMATLCLTSIPNLFPPHLFFVDGSSVLGVAQLEDGRHPRLTCQPRFLLLLSESSPEPTHFSPLSAPTWTSAITCNLVPRLPGSLPQPVLPAASTRGQSCPSSALGPPRSHLPGGKHPSPTHTTCAFPPCPLLLPLSPSPT